MTSFTTTQSPPSNRSADEDAAPAVLLAEWQSAIAVVEEYRRRHLAFTNLRRPDENKSPGFKQLESVLAASEAHAGALKKRFMQQSGFL